jgi:oligoribonuclease
VTAADKLIAGALGGPPQPRDDVLVWLDLEMTGLDPAKNTIIEIATLVSDNDLNVLAEGPEIVINTDEGHLGKMIEIVREMHTKSGLVQRVRQSTVNVRDAERETLGFLRRWCKPRTAPLCGNSIWCDRMFLKLQMPELDGFLHYRTIDVSSFKEVGTRWSVNALGGAPRKGDKHRALDDVRESLAELKHYRDKWLAPQRAPKEAAARAEKAP